MARSRLLALGLLPVAPIPRPPKAPLPLFQEWLADRFPAPTPRKPKPTLAELPEDRRERLRLYMREYRARNLDRLNAKNRERYAKRKAAGKKRKRYVK